MDTSETYIKMRIGAIPDLGGGAKAEPIRDDCYFAWLSASIFIDAKGNWYFDDSGQEVQLERQDQLQEMVVNPSVKGRLYEFADFVHKEPYPPPKDRYTEEGDEAAHFFKSMEQLWLAFCMLERFGKTWTGSEWAAQVPSEVK